MAYRFVIALSRSPPRDNSRLGVQAKDIIWRDCSKKKNLSIAVPAKFIQIVDSFTGLRRRREEGWGGGGALIVVSNRRRCDYGYSPSKFNYVERSVGIIEPRIEGRTRRWIDTISTSLHHPYRPNFLRQASADELWLVFTCRHRATPSL